MGWDLQNFAVPLSVELRDSRLHQLYSFDLCQRVAVLDTVNVMNIIFFHGLVQQDE